MSTTGNVTNDNKEELIVRVFENLTDAEFLMVFDTLKANDCELLHAMYSDIWYSQWDRLATSLTGSKCVFAITLPPLLFTASIRSEISISSKLPSKV